MLTCTSVFLITVKFKIHRWKSKIVAYTVYFGFALTSSFFSIFMFIYFIIFYRVTHPVFDANQDQEAWRDYEWGSLENETSWSKKEEKFAVFL